MSITPELIAQLRAAHAAATPGEWETARDHIRSGLQMITTQIDGITDYVAVRIYPVDADMIALLHNHTVALLDALEEAQVKIETERKERLALAVDYIRTVWFFCPQCWDSINNCEAAIAEITGKSEQEISWQYANETRQRARAESEKQANARNELQEARAEIARLREELEEARAECERLRREEQTLHRAIDIAQDMIDQIKEDN